MYLSIIKNLRYKRNKHVAVKLFDFSEDVKWSNICYNNFKLFILATKICNEIKNIRKNLEKACVRVCLSAIPNGEGVT